MVALAVAVGLVAGCRDGTGPTPVMTAPASPTVAAIDGPVRLHVQLAAGQLLTQTSPQPSGCPGFDALMDLGGRRSVRLSAYAAGCRSSDNGRVGNGRHGVYRSTVDIPAERLAASVRVHTALGDAVVFAQRYYECTNSCRDYTEPVAVLTLDRPADPAYPALMVCSERGTLDLDGLTAVLTGQLRA
jgi:hypothetical protein